VLLYTIRYIFALMLLAGMLLPGVSAAQSVGDLMVAPTRILFEGRDRVQEVNLINRGTKEAVYRVSFQNMSMNEDGGYEEIEEPKRGEKFADGFLRYSPRQVNLKPGEVQKVRIMLRKPADLPEGEYRSHMLFRALPPEDAGKDIESTNLRDGQVAVRLIPIFGVSIPVIVRHGSLPASVQIINEKIVDTEAGGKELQLTLKREGAASIYGDINVNLTPRGGMEPYLIGQLRGASVLEPYETREFRVPLTAPPEISLNDGAISISLRNNALEGSNLLAEKKIDF
jgi:P pilus assembly chaperone PapD